MNIPGYRIEKEIAHGGMATVYLAVQESLDRPVALKVMAPALAADRSFGERFLKEARTVARLNHPNILAVYDVGVSGHHYYLAMELVPGGDLKQRIRQEALPPQDALAIARQMALALGYAHEEGFVHRDVKPENILFRKDGTAVLSDFGIAKAVGSGTKMTGTGMSIGTPHYMSPEQAQGLSSLDGRSDLYSLGVVLHEMLTGQVPFDADNTVGIAMQHVQAPVPRLPQSLGKLQPLLERLLAKDPEQRYQNAGELVQAIDDALAGKLPVSAPKPAAQKTQVLKAEEPTPSGKGSGLKWALGGALLAAVLVGGFL
ncbi:protein kinase domain-containing protein, partial [Geothermobacter hydrogeniphilus]